MNDNTKIQLLAIDLDGTTLRNDASLSSNVKKALEYAIQQDIFVVPCTGRALGSLYAFPCMNTSNIISWEDNVSRIDKDVPLSSKLQ